MKVIALQMGFYGGVRRREGSVFEVGADEKADWFRPVDGKPDGKPDVEKARAELKEKAKAEAKARGEGGAKAKAEAVAKAEAEKAKADADDLV